MYYKRIFLTVHKICTSLVRFLPVLITAEIKYTLFFTHNAIDMMMLFNRFSAAHRAAIIGHGEFKSETSVFFFFFALAVVSSNFEEHCLRFL